MLSASEAASSVAVHLVTVAAAGLQINAANAKRWRLSERRVASRCRWPQAAVWAVRRAERRLSSCLFESEVLRTRGLKRSSSGRTLSGVDLLISMNKADEALGMVLPKSLMNSSLMP